MKIRTLALLLSAAFASPAVLAQAAGYPAPLPQAPTTATPQTPEQWVGRMTDFTQNASAFKDPAAFAAWAGSVSDPAMVSAMGVHMMEPGNMLRSMTTMMQPATAANYMQFSDPNLYMRWGSAMMNPMWYTQMASGMADPGKMMRWAMLPMDPQMWNMGMQMANPNLYMRWMMTPTDPRAMSLMFAPMNPQLWGSMAGGVMNPAMVGGKDSTWGTFMYPAQPVVQMQGAAPVTSPINVFDPSTWFSMMNMFGGMPTMPAMPFPFMAQQGNSYAPAPAAAPAAEPAPEAKAQPQPTRLVLSGDVLFQTGKSSVRDLSAAGRASLDALVAQVKGMGEIESLTITGHADKTGNAAANKRLSKARADAVAAYLKSRGVKARSVKTVGMGDAQPVVECDMKQASAALRACLAPNRRVEVEIAGVK